MKILIISPNYLVDINDCYSYRTIPPLGYGGVENVVYNLISGYLQLGFEVEMIGSPNSLSFANFTNLFTMKSDSDIVSFVQTNAPKYKFIHDHSCKKLFNKTNVPSNYIATLHTDGIAPYPKNVVCLNNNALQLNEGQSIGLVRLPVDERNFFSSSVISENYLYIGRVSKHKGVLEACRIVAALNKINGTTSKIIICGPAWEKDYKALIIEHFSDIVLFKESVFGLEKRELLACAKAIFILSLNVKPPFSALNWVEPGCTIVSEAAASGCPIISSLNGCLSEIVSEDIGCTITTPENVKEQDLYTIMAMLKNYNEKKAIAYAVSHWNYVKIAANYVDIFDKHVKM